MAAQSKIALHVLTAGLVVDRSVLVTQSVTDLDVTLRTLRAHPKRAFIIVENANAFFTAANMLELIKANDDTYKLIAEKAKVVLRDDDVTAIKTAEAAKKAIEASMVPPVPPYPFDDVPVGFDITKTFEICNGAKSLRRIHGHQTLSLMQAQLIWRHLSLAWSRNRPVESKYFREHRVFRLESGRIRIGCQEAYRYEIEQIAVWQGWEFPAPVTK